MHRHSDGLLIVACVVVGLAILTVHGHPVYVPAGLASARTVSVSYAAHMAVLEVRHLAAKVGRIISIN
jgi:tellurite resistance protein TehA-like permease